MAEHPRQEIEFVFGGQTYRVRPTFQIVIGMEAELNQSSRVVGMKLLNAEASVAEIAVVVWHMIKDQKGAPKTRSDVGEIIMDDGYASLIKEPFPLAMFLLRAQKGNKEHEKEAASAKAPKDPPIEG